ncbi:MAG TPA: acyltransferase family protein [Anaerolineae bacterium]|nr:acyltransferase family protein [Anaerolineae bacterium]
MRLHYLDWLRVLAILGVFLYHAVHPFDLTGWHIKNAEQSTALTVVIVFFSLWGMPFFFLIAGTGSWFALRRRTAGQYASERFKRLLIPFVVGAILFMPIMLYFEWSHKTQAGALAVSFQEFVTDRNVGFSPRWFGALGYHLWYLGFLFSFALITLPLFLWLKGASGQRILSRIARRCERRGGILLFVLPLLLVQLGLRPFFLDEHDWADFVFRMSFFVLGYVLFTDERFTRAIRRDWRIILAAAIGAWVLLMGMLATGDPFTWAETPGIPEFYLVWSLITVSAWCWTVFVLFVGIRFLDFSNAWLRYGQEGVLPFFVVHQPVIIVIAFFVVQWNVGVPIKMLTVVLGSFVISVGLYELVIKRIDLLRAVFGMKSPRLDTAQVGTG